MPWIPIPSRVRSRRESSFGWITFCCCSSFHWRWFLSMMVSGRIFEVILVRRRNHRKDKELTICRTHLLTFANFGKIVGYNPAHFRWPQCFDDFVPTCGNISHGAVYHMKESHTLFVVKEGWSRLLDFVHIPTKREDGTHLKLMQVVLLKHFWWRTWRKKEHWVGFSGKTRYMVSPEVVEKRAHACFL